MNNKQRRPLLFLFSLLSIIILGLLSWIMFVRMERQKPDISLQMNSISLGSSQNIGVAVSDPKSGIRNVWVGILKDAKEIPIYQMEFPNAGIHKGGEVREKYIEIPFIPKQFNIPDGNAILKISVWDYSLKNWGKGNQADLRKDIVIDTQKPRIEILSRAHNFTQGGSGLVLYKLSESCRESGVMVGDNFFPGHSEIFNDPNVYAAFCALDHTQGSDTKIWLKAVDNSGNEGRGIISYHINAKSFKMDKIDLSDDFFASKIPEFEDILPREAGQSTFEKFLYINKVMREENAITVFDVARKSENTLFWHGVFLRLPGSANRAGFADHREYMYKGKRVDDQFHLGIDLASLSHSPVLAANDGKVVFADYLGIYGNTVILDHGLGLMSLYSHLSTIGVSAGKVISKNEVIGRTGMSGLAAGDHLHFSMIVHNRFVNPVEWWDPAWIKNNITSKLEEMQ